MPRHPSNTLKRLRIKSISPTVEIEMPVLTDFPTINYLLDDLERLLQCKMKNKFFIFINFTYQIVKDRIQGDLRGREL